MTQYQTNYLKLMDKLPAKGVLNYEKHHSIVTVLDMLFSQTKTQSRQAAALLTFCALLSPWAIPLHFLRNVEIIYNVEEKQLRPTEDETFILANTLQDDLELMLAIDFLAEVSLVKIIDGPETSEGTIVIHSAICRWILETQQSVKEWLPYAVEALIARVRAPIER